MKFAEGEFPIPPIYGSKAHFFALAKNVGLSDQENLVLLKSTKFSAKTETPLTIENIKISK